MARGRQRSLPVLLLMGFPVVLLLGAWGFARYETATLVDHVYRSLQLFVLESGDGLHAPLPWQLEIARLAAPALTITSTVVAIAALSRDRIDGWRARRRHGHVVVCGLGRLGATSAIALRAAGETVVGVDLDPSSLGVSRCRRARIPVVIGDAREPLVLAGAGTHRADHLVVLTPSLDLAGRVALAAVDLVQHRERSPLSIHLEVDEPELAALLRAAKLTEHRAHSWRIEELDLAGVGARAMLDKQPPWSEGDDSAHVLVAGATPLGAAVLLETLRRWRRSGRRMDTLTVSLFDTDRAALERFAERHHDVGVVQQHDTLVDLREAAWRDPVSAAYVCVADETHGLTTALEILRELPAVPVLLRLEQATALGELMHRDAPSLRVISLISIVLTPEVLLESTVERIARALHDAYRRSIAPGSASALPWDELPEDLKESNRAQAGHVADKIRATARILVPDDGQPPDTFSPDEVERLGVLEHERWVEERMAAGWTPGPQDPEARTSPHLVPWEELDEEVREIDRQFVRLLPEVLADAGLTLRRLDARASSTPGDRHEP